MKNAVQDLVKGTRLVLKHYDLAVTGKTNDLDNQLLELRDTIQDANALLVRRGHKMSSYDYQALQGAVSMAVNVRTTAMLAANLLELCEYAA